MSMTETNSGTASKATPGWQDWANRTTAILAVLAALSSGRWGASNLQAILEQGKVNDTWSYYQADSIKAHDAEQIRDLAKALSVDQSADRAKALETLSQQLDARAVQKLEDKQLRKAHAEGYQRSRDVMVERGFWFEVSFAALQLGVILSTIATGTKTKGPWLTACAFGLIGLVVLVNGFHPVFHAPRAFYQGVSEDMGYQADKQK